MYKTRQCQFNFRKSLCACKCVSGVSRRNIVAEMHLLWTKHPFSALAPFRCFWVQRFIFSLRANIEILLCADFAILWSHLPGVNDIINIINLMFNFPLIYIFMFVAVFVLLNKFVNKILQSLCECFVIISCYIMNFLHKGVWYCCLFVI